jgi:hypothetical protein
VLFRFRSFRQKSLIPVFYLLRAPPGARCGHLANPTSIPQNPINFDLTDTGRCNRQMFHGERPGIYHMRGRCTYLRRVSLGFRGVFVRRSMAGRVEPKSPGRPHAGPGIWFKTAWCGFQTLMFAR